MYLFSGTFACLEGYAFFYLLRHTPELVVTRHQQDEPLMVCRYRLSAFIDRGRFFLPNVAHERVGVYKPPAYRGYRHPAIDYLVGAYRILDDAVPVEELDCSKREALTRLKRQFVSSIQVVLDPRSHTRDIKQLVEESQAENVDKESPVGQLLNKLLPSKNKTLV